MSITQAAQLLRQQGRGKDSELMHVTPNEVNALQGLARAHGGSLTTNPQTGLPEAGFLEDVLPTVIGTAVGTAVGMPWLGAAIGGGLSYATTGSLEKGLMSGLGAFGGASALSSVGALGAGSSTASSVAGLAPEASIAADTANFANIGSSAAPAVQGGGIGSLTGAQNFAQMGAMDKFGAVGKGFSSLIADPSQSFAAMGGLKGQGANLAMMGAPLLSSIYNNGDTDNTVETPATTIRPAAYDPKTQTYTQLAPVDYNDWGDQSFAGYRASQGYADGGAVDDSVVTQRYAPNVRTVDPAVTQYNQMLMNQAQQEYVQGQPMTGVAALAPGVALGNRMQAARDAAATTPETGITSNVNTKTERIYNPVTQMYIANPNYVPPPPPVDSGFNGFGGYGNFNGGNQNDGTGGSSAGSNDGNGGNGSGGGNAGGCVDPAVMVLMADKTERRAGDVQVGDMVYAPHQDTLAYGEFKVLESEVLQQPKLSVKFEDASTIVVSDTHKFYMSDATWKQMLHIKLGDTVRGIAQDKKIIGMEYIGDGDVIRFNIDDAHTYISDGLVSHNSKKEGGLIRRRYAQGGIMSVPTFQEGGELASDAFIVPADVVSALGNGSTDAGVRILNQYLGQAMKVEGAGDGLSDDINASIEGGQPARIADGEVYIDDARVAELGGGDSERGAAMLYAMMDKVRESAHGKKSQQKEVNPEQVMPV